MAKYRKKPVVIDAWEWDESRKTLERLEAEGMVHGGHEGHVGRPDWVHGLRIRTLESGGGYHYVDKGDWIIKGVAGEFYPCKPAVFEATYEAAS